VATWTSGHGVRALACAAAAIVGMAGYASDDEAAVTEPTVLRSRAPPNAARSDDHR
jgi:hypothetical protein